MEATGTGWVRPLCTEKGSSHLKLGENTGSVRELDSSRSVVEDRMATGRAAGRGLWTGNRARQVLVASVKDPRAGACTVRVGSDMHGCYTCDLGSDGEASTITVFVLLQRLVARLSLLGTWGREDPSPHHGPQAADHARGASHYTWLRVGLPRLALEKCIEAHTCPPGC